MLRRWIVLAAITGIAIGVLARPAAAQYGGNTNKAAHPLAITAGWAWNQGSTPVDNEMIVGLQYTFPSMIKGGSEWMLSADWLRVDSESIVGIPVTRRRVSLVPVLLNYKHYFQPSWYGFAGAGARWAEKDVPEMRVTDRFGFVWQVGLGYEFGHNWFVEGRWQAGTHPSDDGILNAQLGLRF